MPFQKGHKLSKGRGKRKKEPRRNLTDNNDTGRNTKANPKNVNGCIDKFPITKKWDTSFRGKTLDPELVDWYINNDLDLTELFDDIKEYKRNYKGR